MSALLSPGSFPLVVTAVAFALVAWIVLRDHPRLLVVSWLVVLCFAPVWLGVSIAFYFEPAALVALVALAASVPWTYGPLTSVDRALVVLLLVCLVPLVTGGATRTTVFTLLAQYAVPFVLGRIVVRRVGTDFIYQSVAVVFTIVAVLGVVEFASGFNPFVLLTRGNDLYSLWGVLQPRGAFVRAEGAFGHSIALGCSLALAMPLVLASRFAPRTRLLMVAVMLVAVVLTLSRTAMLCAAGSLVLSAAFLREAMAPRVRAGVAVAVAVAAIAATPFVSRVFAEAGTEATGSSAYRGSLLALVPDMALLGRSSAAVVTADGRLFFGSFRSIDSVVILFGLTYGLVPLLIALGCVVAGGLSLLLSRATPAVVAISAQAPALVTVAFITQYGSFFWFVAGLAVGSFSIQSDGRRRVEAPNFADRLR